MRFGIGGFPKIVFFDLHIPNIPSCLLFSSFSLSHTNCFPTTIYAVFNVGSNACCLLFFLFFLKCIIPFILCYCFFPSRTIYVVDHSVAIACASRHSSCEHSDDQRTFFSLGCHCVNFRAIWLVFSLIWINKTYILTT